MSVKLTENQQKIALCAAILGFLQGMTWVILSLISIGFYLNEGSPPLTMENYGDLLDYTLYYYFLWKGRIDGGQTLNPEVFCGFMFIYLILDLVWESASIYLFIEVRKKSDKIPRILKIWGGTAALICLIDFIMVAMLASDYDSLCASFPILGDTTLALAATMCANAMLITMVLAAKGFVLWFINAALAKVTITMGMRVN